MEKPISRQADLKDRQLLVQLLHDLYQHNGSRLPSDLYRAKTGQGLAPHFVNAFARRLGLRTVPAARAAAIRRSALNRGADKKGPPEQNRLSRLFLSLPAPADTIGKRHYGQ